ncbi:MAG: hypothetical protein ACLQPD_04860 [Desulfomonilaceae bacterium]
MPTFRFNSEKPYYQDGRLVKKVHTQHDLKVSASDCAILGFTAISLLGKLAVALIFRRNPYRLP